MKRVLLLVAAVGAVTAASAASSAFAAATLIRPTAAQVRPQAFASCPALVSYAKSHFAVTHGLPEPAVEPAAQSPAIVGGARRAPVVGAGGNRRARAARPTPARRPTRRRTTRSRASTSPTSSRRTARRSSPSRRTSSTRSRSSGGTPTLARLARPRRRRLRRAAAALRQPADRDLRRRRPGYVPGRDRRDGAAPSARRSSPRRTTATAPRRPLTEVDVHDPSAMAVTQTMTVDGRFVDARQNGATARIVISSAPHVIAEPQLRPTTARLGADAAVQGPAHGPPLHAPRRRLQRRSAARSTSPGSGC